MFLVNYYRITKKLRKSKAKYGNLVVDDIIVVEMYNVGNPNARFGSEMNTLKFDVYFLDGDKYSFICEKWIHMLPEMMSKKDDDGAVYQVEEVYPPEVPVREEEELWSL